MADGLTVKQIADIVGKDKQKTYRVINKLKLQPITQEKNRILYPEDAAEKVAAYFHDKGGDDAEEKQEPAGAENTAMLAMLEILKKQLEEKDKQLAEKDLQLAAKDEQITELTQAVKSATDSIKAAQAVNIADKQLLLEAKRKPRFWPFGKKKQPAEENSNS